MVTVWAISLLGTFDRFLTRISLRNHIPKMYVIKNKINIAK